MRHGSKKLAVAAAIITALIVVMEHLSGSTNGTGVAWGDVRDAFLAQRWVHVKYDNGEERWSNLLTGEFYYKNWDGRCGAANRERNILQEYSPSYGQHISERRYINYKDGIVPPREPKTAWESIVGPSERTAERGRLGDYEVERHVDQASGGKSIRFDTYFNDAAGRRLLVRQLWADPKTRLPLSSWERLSLADREEQGRESIAGIFDFPETGPASLYDLGVPRDLPVVKSYDKTPMSSVVEVLKAAEAALARFPARYRAVAWENDQGRKTELNGADINVVWRDGQRIHHNQYFSMPVDIGPQYHLDLPATVQQVLKWTQTQIPVSTYLFDGEKDYTRHYAHSLYQDSRDEARVTRALNGDLLPTSSHPIEKQWPYGKRNPASFEMITDAPEELSGYIGLRTNSGDIRREFYIDPEHDYICVRWIWWKQRSDQWEKEREYEYSDFMQLPGGQWYAAKRDLVTYPDPERGTVKGGENLNIDVQVLEEADFPPDTFNGEKLLEGAKLETY